MNSKKNTSSIVLQLLDKISKKCFDSIQCYSPQLFVKTSLEKDNIKPVPSATGVLINVQGNKFLITAGHFLEETEAENIGIMINNKFYILNGDLKYISPSSGEMENKLDVGVWKLESEVISSLETKYSFLPFDKIDFNHTISLKPEYLIVGYPWKMTVEKHSRKTWEVSPFIFLTDKADNSLYKRLNFQEHSNLLLHYREKKVRNTTSGFVQKNKSPEGISGCGVWHIPIPDILTDFSNFKLVGIITEQDKSKTLLISTRIHIISEILRNHFKLKLPVSNITRLV